MPAKRDHELEKWLRNLVQCYQDSKRRPADRVFGNLDDLSAPTQLLALRLWKDNIFRTAIIITHEPKVANCAVSAFQCEDVESLVSLAKSPPRVMLWRKPYRNPNFSKDYLQQPMTLATIAIESLHREIKNYSWSIGDGFAFSTRSLLQMERDGLIWNTCGTILPSALETLEMLGEKHHEPKLEIPEPILNIKEKVDQFFERGAGKQKNASYGYFCFASPPIWFGEPPFLSQEEIARGFSGLRKAQSATPRIIGSQTIGGIPVTLFQ